MIAAILGGALMLLLFVGSMLGSTLQQAHEKKTRAQKQRLETDLKAGEKHHKKLHQQQLHLEFLQTN